MNQTARNIANSRWSAIILISAVYALAVSQIGVLTTLFPLLKVEFELSHQQLGVFATAYLLARATFGTAWGIGAGRFGQKKVLLLTAVATSLAIISTGFAQSYSQLLALYLISVLCAVAAEPITFTLASMIFDSKDRGKAFGTMRALRGLAGGALVAAVGWFGGFADGWRYALFTFGAVELVVAAGIALKLKPTQHTPEIGSKPFEWTPFRRLVKSPIFILFTLTHILASGMLIPVFMPTFLVEERGQTIQSAALLVGSMKVAMIVGSLIGGYLGDKSERIWPLTGRLYLMLSYTLVFSVLTALQFLVNWPHVSCDWVIAIVASAIFPIGFAGCVLPLLADVVAPQLRSASFAVMASLCQGLSLAGISTLIGNFSDQHSLGTMLFWTISIPYLLNAFVCFGLFKYYPKIRAAAMR